MSIYFNSLTSKQKEVYSAIETYMKSKGIPPTVREIGEMVGERTPGAVQGILNRLEQKGVIRRQMGMARSIQLVYPDEDLYAEPVYIPEIKKITQRNIDNLLNVYNIIKYQPVYRDLIGSSEKCFLIKCPDNSMPESVVKYGDILLVAMDSDIKDGDIILVLYENHAYLRYYYKGEQHDTVVLKADTNLINREVFNTNEIKIVGKLTGRFEKFA